MNLTSLIASKISTFQHGYYLWVFVYGLLGLGSIGGPAVAALKQNGDRLASIIGGVCVAVFGFLQPNVYATAFDNALKIAREVEIKNASATAKPEDLLAELIKAEEITHFNYSGLQSTPAASTTSLKQ